jgi:hypothetical protein
MTAHATRQLSSQAAPSSPVRIRRGAGRFAHGALAAAVLGATMLVAVRQAAAATADLSGVWTVIGSHPLLRTKDGKVPPLLPEAKAVYEKNIAARKAGDRAFDHTSMCLPPGMPRTLYMSRFRLLQEPNVVGLLFEWNHLFHSIYMQGRNPTVYAQGANESETRYLGNAVGEWEGNTLVVNTTDIDDSTLLDEALPHGPALHLTERLTLKGSGKILEDEITIDDSQTFSDPWTTVVRFSRQPENASLKEVVCVDREHLVPSLMGAVREGKAN